MRHVIYYEDGIRKEADYSGTDQELRARLSAEGKVVIKTSTPLCLFRPAVKRKDLAAVLIAIGDLLKAGVPLSDSLVTTIRSLEKGSALIPILAGVKVAVKEGREFSSALAAYRALFGSAAVSLIQAGEKSGRLAECLLGAAQYMTNVENSREEMKKTLFYPMIVFVMSLIALVVNTQFVIPKILASPLFKTAIKGETSVFIQALSLLTRLVPGLFVVVVIAIAAVAVLYKSKPQMIDNLLFSTPMLKELFFYQGYYVAFFSLSKLMESGVQLKHALEIVQDASDNRAIRSEFTHALNKVKDGEAFSAGFSCLKPIEKTMLDVAHSTDRVTENLALVADRFYRGYIESVKALGPKVYVFTLLFAGGIFLLMLAGIMIPYGKLLGGVRG